MAHLNPHLNPPWCVIVSVKKSESAYMYMLLCAFVLTKVCMLSLQVFHCYFFSQGYSGQAPMVPRRPPPPIFKPTYNASGYVTFDNDQVVAANVSGTIHSKVRRMLL